jgi:hypothetical protein
MGLIADAAASGAALAMLTVDESKTNIALAADTIAVGNEALNASSKVFATMWTAVQKFVVDFVSRVRKFFSDAAKQQLSGTRDARHLQNQLRRMTVLRSTQRRLTGVLRKQNWQRPADRGVTSKAYVVSGNRQQRPHTADDKSGGPTVASEGNPGRSY